VTSLLSPTKTPVTRRSFLTASACAAGGLALYSGEIARHWIEISPHEVLLPGLPAALDGMRLAQISDIHLDEFTEPYFLREAVRQTNRLNPDAVLLTGDYITYGLTYQLTSRRSTLQIAWNCAEILKGLECKKIFAVLGNHDTMLGPKSVTRALTASGIIVLNNNHLPLERDGARIWIAGVEDPLTGKPDPDKAIPAEIRNVQGEPVVLLCHCPDYADSLLAQPAGHAVSLMVSGHTHGGQVRLPFVPPVHLPDLGQKYIQGWFQLGAMQLHVNRGLGTIGVPFRLNCPPEISLLTLRA
jgi:predicted MPP superfamily phosphohydrolase